jgi:hypothetical protein
MSLQSGNFRSISHEASRHRGPRRIPAWPRIHGWMSQQPADLLPFPRHGNGRTRQAVQVPDAIITLRRFYVERWREMEGFCGTEAQMPGPQRPTQPRGLNLSCLLLVRLQPRRRPLASIVWSFFFFSPHILLPGAGGPFPRPFRWGGSRTVAPVPRPAAGMGRA